MQVERLSIKHVRAIEQLDLDLSTSTGEPRRRLILLGANGAGKTTILDAVAHAFHVLCDVAPGGKNLGASKLGAGDVRNVAEAALSSRATPRFGVVELGVRLSEQEQRTARLRHPDTPGWGKIRIRIGASLLSDVLLAGSAPALREEEPFQDAARDALLDREAGPPCVLLPADRGILELRDDLPFRQVAEFEPSQGCLSRERDRFAPVAARMALALMGGRRHDPTGTVARMWRVLEKYLPELPRPLDPGDPHAPFQTSSGAVVSLNALSDGERAILLLFGEVALRSPRDGVLLIDEIEQHLHPRWQRAVLDGIAALVPSAQVIVATQSPYVAACAPDDVLEIGDWRRDGE